MSPPTQRPPAQFPLKQSSLEGAPHGDSFGVTNAEASRMREELVRAVRRYCPRYLADQSEDLVQIALIRVVEARKRRETEPHLRASYLWRAAHSAVIDEIRRRQRRPEAELDPEGPDPAAEVPGPERQTVDREAGMALRDCLGALIESRRSAVTLHLHGLRLSQVAERMGWNEKRAKNLVYRGLSDLRMCLIKKGFDRGEG